MSYNKTKTNPNLGIEIHEHLKKCGVETPSITLDINRKDKIEKIEYHFNEIMTM